MVVISWSKQVFDEMKIVVKTYGITLKHFMAYKGRAAGDVAAFPRLVASGEPLGRTAIGLAGGRHSYCTFTTEQKRFGADHFAGFQTRAQG